MRRASTSELRPMLTLAGPVILAEIGWMSMGIVDTIMVGPLGPAAIGATGMGSSIFFAFAVFGMGMMLGVDALVSRSYGSGRLDDCIRWLQHGALLALIVSPAVMLVFYGALTTVDRWGFHPEVLALARPYLGVIGLGTVPLLFYATFRRYLQGLHVVRPVMFALITANLVNAFSNWVLIYGKLGAPALGVPGAAWATVLARVYMAAFLFVAIVLVHRDRGEEHPHVAFAFDASRMRRPAGRMMRTGPAGRRSHPSTRLWMITNLEPVQRRPKPHRLGVPSPSAPATVLEQPGQPIIEFLRFGGHGHALHNGRPGTRG